MSVVKEEDYLVLLIDSFFDFKDGILILGYDLRIDAYTYFHLSPPLKKMSLVPEKIYQVKRKLTSKSSISALPGDEDDIYVEQKIKNLEPSKLNAIEKIYYTNYLHHKKKEPTAESNENVILAIGKILSIENRVSILGPCYDMKVWCPDVNQDLIIRVQTNTFEVNDSICFLLRKIPSSQGWIYRILGFKDKQQTKDYLNPDFLNSKNQEINPIDFR